MKRPAKNRENKRTGDVLKDLSQNQLAWIGSVALAYNEAELLIDIIVGFGFWTILNSHELTSRINGVDGKIALAKIGVENLKGSAEFKRLLADTLGEAGFSLLKKLRDRILHARIVDAAAAIAHSPASRGKFDEILLTEDSLAAVYNRLAIIRYELIAAVRITGDLWMAAALEGANNVATSLGNEKPVAQHKAESESRIQEGIAQLRQCQKDRLSLKPIPEFPAESELNAADAKAAQDQQDDLMKGLGPLPDYLKNNPLPRLGSVLKALVSDDGQ
jgi:hypothetical protein